MKLMFEDASWRGPKHRAHFQAQEGARRTGVPTVGTPILRAAFLTRKRSLLFERLNAPIGNLVRECFGHVSVALCDLVMVCDDPI